MLVAVFSNLHAKDPFPCLGYRSQEGKALIPHSARWDVSFENQVIADIIKLQRTTVAKIHVGKYRAETTDGGRLRTGRSGNEEGHIGYVAPDRREYPLRTEHAKSLLKNRITERLLKPKRGVAWTSLSAVVKRAPRLLRKPSNGVEESVVAAPPPSQLISRRPLGSGPGSLPLLGSPKAARKAFTVSRIDAVVASPPSEKGRKCTKDAPRERQANSNQAKNTKPA